MQPVSLQSLLEAGCHFGHKAERWNPRASEFIYIEKDGIHIIDLAKTKSRLETAATLIRDIVARGDEVLFVATKRQAKDIVRLEAQAVGAPYLVERWIGGFLTNWDSIKKNIEKINRLADEQEHGGWKQLPKHEQSKLARYLKRLKVFYGGVLTFTAVPAALFVIDIRKEDAAVREATRRGLPVIGLVDTNSDPNVVEYPIPGNDDAVGSIALIAHTIALAYKEGKDMHAKALVAQAADAQEAKAKAEIAAKEVAEAKSEEVKVEPAKKEVAVAEKPTEATTDKPVVVKKPRAKKVV